MRSSAPVIAPWEHRSDACWRELRAPLSFNMEQMLVLWQQDRDSAVYNMPTVVNLNLSREGEGASLIGRVRSALSWVVRRHEALRTRFGRSEDSSVGQQVIASASSYCLPLQELSVSRHAEAVDALAWEASRSFDLYSGPLARFALVCVARESASTHTFEGALGQVGDDDGQAALLVNMHHSISDGWSNGVLRRELVVASRERSVCVTFLLDS